MKKNLLHIAAAVVLVLLVPLLAMQFTDEVNWGVFDFVLIGALLFAAGVGIDYVLNKVTPTPKKVVSITLIILLFLLVWAEFAVGIL